MTTKKKRDFGKTPEPEPAAPEDAGGGRSFVVHRHEARNLHYDLRLEHRGVLCSWAVPKGLPAVPTTLHRAFVVYDNRTSQIFTASNPVPVTLR
jgi:DNA ligase D-like protein (predicted 3'-phosphoesterase)